MPREFLPETQGGVLAETAPYDRRRRAMQRTLVLTGVAIVLAAAAGFAVATERLPRGWKLGALWSGPAQRVKALVGRSQRSPEGIAWPEAS